MTAKVTEASRRRMQVRDQFVHLGPPYVTIESRATSLPVIGLTIEGLPASSRLAESVVSVLRDHYAESVQFRLVTRTTA